MTETMHLSVNRIIGTGDPFDTLMLIPLISQWRVPKNCLWAMTGEECDRPLQRLYVLNEPLDGNAVVGVCEAHHKALGGE